MAGATIIEGVPVTDVLQPSGARHRRAHRARRHRGEYVVNCAGMWARQLGRTRRRHDPESGGRALLPDHRARSPDLPPTTAGARGPGVLRLLPRGGRRPDGRPVRAGVRAVERRRHSGGLLLRRDPARLGPHGAVPREGDEARAGRRWRSGIRKFFCGPESFTPDLRPIVGEAPELKNYFVAAGLNSIGILTGGGLGRVLAHWIVNGTPGRRRDRLQHRPAAHAIRPIPSTAATRTIESLGMVYKCHYPTMIAADRARREELRRSRPAGRSARLLPRRQRLGRRRLVRARGPRAEGREALVGPAELVSVVGGRAPRRARGRDPHGHVVHVQVPGAGPRRGPACSNHISANDVDGDAGPHHLHAVAQRARARSRPTSR